MADVVKCPKCKKQQSSGRVSCAYCETDLSSAASVPFWKTYGERDERVVANPIGTDLGLDSVLLRRKGGVLKLTEGVLMEAFERFKQHPVEAIAIYFFVTLLGANIWFTLEPTTKSTSYLIAVLGTLYLFKVASWVARIPLEAGASTFWLRSWRDQEMELGNVLVGFKYLKPLLFANLITGVAISVGLALLVVPGVILACGLPFVSLLIVDKNLSWQDAIKASWQLTDGHKMELFKLFAVLVAINALAALLCVIPVIVTVPISYGALVLVYQRLVEPGNSYLEYDPPPPPDEPEPLDEA